MHDQFDISLEDSDLLGEVELTTNLIVAASASDDALSVEEIDEILGVVPRAAPARPTASPIRIPPRGMLGFMAEHQHGYIHRKDDYLKRLRRIEGQARGLQRMVEEEKYCIDILTQVSAMTKALQAVSIGLLEEHLAHCVVDAARAGDDDEAARRSPRPSTPSRGW